MSTRAFPIAIVLLLTLSALATVPLAQAGAAIPRTAVPAVTCPPWNNFTTNLSWGTNSGWVGPAPVNVTIDLSVDGAIGTYAYNLSIGSVPRYIFDGQFNQTNASGLATVTTVDHPFTLPGNYTLNVTVDYACGPVYASASYGTVLPVYGPAGPNPVGVTGSQTSQYVSGMATYTATVHGRPAGSTLLWAIDLPGPGSAGNGTGNWYSNLSMVNVTPLAPGQVTGWLYVEYPSGFLYATTELPTLAFQPDLVVAVNFTGPAPGSPTTTTMYANTTHVPGAPTVSGASISWQFPDGLPNGVAVTGSRSGSPITPTFFFNTSRPSNWTFEMEAVSFGLVGGTSVVLGSQNFAVGVSNLTGGPTSPVLHLSVVNGSLNVSGGVFSFQLTAGLSSPGGYLYDLDLDGYNQSSGLLAWTHNQTTNWNGSWFNLGLSEPATNYTAIGWVYQLGANSSQTLVASANVSVPLPAGGSTGCTPGCTTPPPGPLSLALSATPSNGTATLNVSVSVTATGGVVPYNLSVCVRGPSATTSVTGACGPATTVNGWNGNAYPINEALNGSGYYAVNATVSDSNGSFAWASTVINVSAAVGRPLLQAQASVIAPTGGTGGTYSFVTQVSGGVAPYDIQWTFGDGTSGSAVAGSTISHVYTVAGTYEPTLRVTDAHGTVVVTHVAPFTVSLPPASGTRTSGLTSFDEVVLGAGAAVVLASLLALALVARWATRRREALNWLSDLEQGRGPAEPPRTP
jgi:hypothetical protein